MRRLPALAVSGSTASGDLRYLLVVAAITLAAGMLFKVAAANRS